MSGRLSSYVAVGFLLSSVFGPAQEKTLIVAAASDLSALGQELKAGFCKDPITCPLRMVSGSSAVLAQQIDRAAQFDLFLSANSAYVDQLASNGKIVPGSVKPYAIGRLGVLWRDGEEHPLGELHNPALPRNGFAQPKIPPC